MTTAITHTSPWRIAGWSLLAALLVLPAVAMRFTGEVVWTLSDFVFAGGMLGALGVGFELVARLSATRLIRSAMAAALVVLFLLVWVELAVGILD